MNLYDISGRIAIVTGGGRGIGFEIAKGLASAGATVIISDRRAAEGQKAAESLKKEGLNTVAIPVDVTSMSSVAALVSKVINNFGEIDILVNNAGTLVRKAAEDITEEDWDHVMNTNLKGLFFCCQFVGREMIQRGRGRIINVSSLRAKKMGPNRSVYAISKAGVSNLTKVLAYEWGKYNVTVNAIAPATTITDINRKYFEDHPDELAEIVKSIPRGRAGHPSDYIGAVIFLASDASDFVTGQTLFVDGGTTIC